MPPSRSTVVMALLLLVLPESARAVCPNYPYPSLTDRCRRDAYCGWLDVEGAVTDDGVVETDQPSPMQDESAAPIAFSQEAMAGRADLFAISRAEADAARGVVNSSGEALAEAPCCKTPTTSNGRLQVLSVARVGDLVFSGPAAEVETSLHLVFDGSSDQVTTGVEGATAISQLTAFLGGGICGHDDPFGFSGMRTLSLRDDNNVDDLLVVSANTGILEDVELDRETELVVGPFTVPTGESLELELWLQSDATAATGGGYARSLVDFSASIGPLEGGPVFDLPAGYTADSPEAGIFGNTVPEPASDLMAAVALLSILARRRR